MNIPATLRGGTKEEDNWSPLFVAAREGNLRCVKALITARADVNFQNTIWGSTPVNIAAQRGHVDVIRTLSENGADLNRAFHGGESPLYTAAYNNRVEVIEALLELYGLERHEIVNYVTQKGFTSLHAAALQGHPKCIRALIKLT